MNKIGPSAHGVQIAESSLPTRFGDFTIHVYEVAGAGRLVALVKGDPASVDPVTVRLHSECMTGDVFQSLRCDCGPQLEAAMNIIEHEGVGVVIYLDQEGRGIGLLNKIRAYRLQDFGLDTVDANLALGFDADLRDYNAAASVLRNLGIPRVRLLTNNPRKVDSLAALGIEVDRIPLIIDTNPHNERYLAAKVRRLGHDLTPAHGPKAARDQDRRPLGRPDEESRV